MTSMVCLQGGGEFSPGCRTMDAELVRRAGGRVVVSALAGSPGSDYRTATANGVRHFRAVGAVDVVGAPDARDEPAAAIEVLRTARLLVLPGGSPSRLLAALQQTGVGQLVAGEPEQLLAHDLGGQETVAAVGQRVCFVQPWLFGQVGLDDAEQPLHVARFLGAERHEFGERVAGLHLLQPRREIRAALDLVGSRASTEASSLPNLPASTTSSITSTSETVPVTARLSERFNAATCRVWKPGVSTNTNCATPRVRMPVMRWRVVCALLEVMLIF